MDIKLCTSCKEEKPLSEFYKSKGGKDGLHSSCKSCFKAYRETEKVKASSKKALRRATEKGYYRKGKGKLHTLNQRAEKLGVNFDLTAESLDTWFNSTEDKCCYCNILIDDYIKIHNFVINYTGNNFEIEKFKRFYKNPKHQAIQDMTIDRIDNQLGYSIDNIVKACWICNSLKSNFFDDELMSIISPKIISKLQSEIANEKEGKLT